MFTTRAVDLEILDASWCERVGILARQSESQILEIFCAEMPSENIQDEIKFLTGRREIVFHLLRGAEREAFETALAQIRIDGHLTATHQGITDSCPHCGSDNVKEILYGYPEEELSDLLDRYVMGGCCISPGSADIRCGHCGYEWKI